MANTLGGLIVTLGLNAVEFIQGLTKAEYQAKKFASSIDKNMATVRTAFKAIGVGLIVKEVFDLSKAIIDNAAALNDLSDITGSSVENLSRLSNQAEIAGGSFEELKGALEKLSVGMGGSGKRSEEVANALKLLGVTAKDPAEALNQIAVSLNKYADGTGKAAIANALFGKSGAAFLATLKDIANLQDVVGTTTTEQARKAEELEQAYRRLGVEATAFKNIILSDVVPALLSLITTFVEARKASAGFIDTLRLLSNFSLFGSAKDDLVFLNSEIAKLEKTVANPTFLGFKVGVSDQLVNDLERMKAARQILVNEQARNLGGFPSNEPPPKPKPELKFVSAADKAKGAREAERAAEAQLTAQLKLQENLLKAENDRLQDIDHLQKDALRDNLIGFRQYYAERLQLLDDAQAKEISSIQEQLRLAKEFSGRRDQQDPSEQIKNAQRIEDIQAKLADSVRENARARADAERDAANALRDYGDAVNEVRADVLALRGDLEQAAAIRFERQNRGLIAQAGFQGDTATANQIELLRNQEQAQIRLGKAADQYQRTLERLGIAQARINLEQESGSITTLDAINKRSALARDYVVILREQISAQERLVASLTSGPAQDAAIDKLNQMRLAVDQLAESANELENIFRKTFEDAATDALTNFITTTKSAKDAIKDFEKQVVASISRMASQNIAESIFGKSGPAGGFAGLLASMFGGGGGIHGGGIGDAFIKAFGFSGGTNYAPGGMALVGERGPEIVNLPRGAQVIPNHELVSRRSQRGGDVHVNVNVLPGATRSTADQAALRAGVEFQRALARNG